MKLEDLTKKEQIFFRERYLKYIKDEYNEDFVGNREGRTWGSGLMIKPGMMFFV